MVQPTPQQPTQENEAPESKLLDLPAELRNDIYRLVVLQDRKIPITHQGIDEPPLLRACKQIRDEASPIYYTENRFVLYNYGYDSDLVMKWEQKENCELFKRHKIVWNVVLSPDRTPNWQNLSEWLKRYHADATGIFLLNTSSGSTLKTFRCWQTLDHLVGSMFNVVDKMKSLPWTEVEEVLEDHHKILILHDERWK